MSGILLNGVDGNNKIHLMLGVENAHDELCFSGFAERKPWSTSPIAFSTLSLQVFSSKNAGDLLFILRQHARYQDF